jgi:hypothetical protein
MPSGICRAFTIALIVIPLQIASDSLGAFDSWRYVIAYMACAGLAPVLICSVINFSWEDAANNNNTIEYNNGATSSKKHEEEEDMMLLSSYYLFFFKYNQSKNNEPNLKKRMGIKGQGNNRHIISILIQVCISLALLGLAANLVFVFDNTTLNAAIKTH